LDPSYTYQFTTSQNLPLLSPNFNTKYHLIPTISQVFINLIYLLLFFSSL
jgi:hypothetical protein